MTLDPVFGPLLNGLPDWDISKMSAPDVRTMMHPMFAALAAKDVPIGKVTDVVAPGLGGDIAMRVYTPVAAPAVIPAVVFFHGGGFVIGNVELYDSFCRMLANESGARVVSVEYRLAPEHPFPAAVDDAFAAVKWVEVNAASLGVDANAIAVAGDSAGGNLAAVVCQLARKSGPKITFQLLIYPWLSAVDETESIRRLGHGYFLDKPAMEWFGGLYFPRGTDLSDPRVSPLSAPDFSGLPPAYVIAAGFDPLRDEGIAYVDKLKAAGVPATLVDYPSMIHGFVSMGAAIPLANEALAAAGRAVKDALAKA